MTQPPDHTPDPHATPGEGTRRGVCTRAAYEGDIEDRLRNWHGLHLAHFGERAEEAAAEIARLREAIRRLADQDATLSACNGNVTVTMDTPLTDAEREAVEACAVLADKTDLMISGFGGQWKPRAATLRGLLERTK
jgi:hypothetical protein